MGKISHIRSRDMKYMNPQEFRNIVRRGEWTGDILDKCQGYASTNLVIVPKDYAFAFILFCLRNPQPCPLVDVTEPGSPHPLGVAPDADLRSDLARYRVFKDGHIVDEPTDINDYWRGDLVAFLLGSIGSIDGALEAANVQYRRTGAYTTNIQCIPSGPFHGPIVVSGKLFKSTHDAIRGIQISSRMPIANGPPVHIGNPSVIGIKDICQPEVFLSESITPQEPEEIAVFWATAVTAQAVAIEAKIPFMITHYPAHTFVTDKLSEEMAVI